MNFKVADVVKPRQTNIADVVKPRQTNIADVVKPRQTNIARDKTNNQCYFVGVRNYSCLSK